MSSRLSFILILLTCYLTGWAEDSIPQTERIRIYYSPGEDFVSQIYRNPAINYYFRNITFSELSLGWKHEKANKPLILQKGNGDESFIFNASSYLSLKKNSKVWGDAHFYTGEKKEITYNESSDLDIVYPYISADTLGGNLNYEEYFFAGGYAQETRKITWGIYADYRALMEFRRVDPRPKNTTSDLNVSAGITFKTKSHYSGGFALHARKYKQTNLIKFFSELGGIKILHASGLGMDYNRFSGNNTNSYYKGWGYGISLSLFPKTKQGIFITTSYDYFTFEKIISDLNELPLNQLNENKAAIEIGYRFKREYREWGVKLQGKLLSKKGIENLFGDAASNIYPQIGEAKQFTLQNYHAALEATYGKLSQSKRYQWFILPRLGMNNTEIKYADPHRLMKLCLLSGGVEFRLSAIYKKSIFQFHLEGEYNYTYNSDLQQTEIEEKQKMLYPLQINYSNLSGNGKNGSTSIRWDHPIAGDKGIFISLQYSKHFHANSIHNDGVQIKGGLTF
ncbi:DUF6850 family outer membrane beta-barrel protein [Gabonibacter chumensis]|uniref:DUF6850 family outer membrane beta-barrel protein n=1 Tax=Gabonibacter chumensis TaxID=2972474 RepID=UPI00257391A1|nr:DUF6850 family outer membrane beta-barrel protein [Gabonibacter chumensis]MCR9012161.1 hypothetical protein [Gabonibacter chumensis]